MRRQTTKELLGESFRELAKWKPVNKITIANITDNCGMTQPTFYNHFRDKYDLMTWLYVSDTKSIMGQIGKDGYQWRDTLLDGMRYSAEHKSELLNAFTHTSGREAFLGYMMQANLETTLENIKANGKVAIAAANPLTAEAYQVKGTAELVTAGTVYEHYANLAEETYHGAHPVKCAVIVTPEKLIVASPDDQNKREIPL